MTLVVPACRAGMPGKNGIHEEKGDKAQASVSKLRRIMPCAQKAAMLDCPSWAPAFTILLCCKPLDRQRQARYCSRCQQATPLHG